MRSNVIFAIIGFSLLTSPALAEQKPQGTYTRYPELALICDEAGFCAPDRAFVSKNFIKNPATGILCDQYICVDKNGVSKELTTKYLDKERADKAFSQGDFDTTAFTFANGIFCDTNTKLCHVDRYFEADGKRSRVFKEYTEKLFGQTE